MTSDWSSCRAGFDNDRKKQRKKKLSICKWCKLCRANLSNHVDKKRNLVSYELSACREKQKSIHFQYPVYSRRFLSDFSFLLGLDCQTQTLVCNLLHLLWNTNYFMEKTQTTSFVSAQSLALISVKRPALVSKRALKVFLRPGQDDNLATDEGQLFSAKTEHRLTARRRVASAGSRLVKETRQTWCNQFER